MKWLWSLLIKNGSTKTRSTLPEARRAREVSQQDLEDIRNQRPEVQRLANDLRAATVQAKITEIFEGTIKKGPGKAHG